MTTFNGTNGSDFEVLKKGTEYDTLYGGNADDELVGFAPFTSVYGGRGNDVVAAAFFAVSGAGNPDNPIHGYVTFDLSSLGLGDHTTLASVVEGGDGTDVVLGSNGADVLYGGDGDDSGIINFAGLEFMTAGLYGGKGDDYLDGGRGDDLLDGGTAADKLIGGDGNDTLIGGLGKDRLIGGDGADKFVLSGKLDSVKGIGRDVIKDFSHAEFDKIDVSLIDANEKLVGDQKFKYIGDNAFTHHRGELHEIQLANKTLVEGDTNGDGKADFQIEVTGHLHLVKADFIL